MLDLSLSDYRSFIGSSLWIISYNRDLYYMSVWEMLIVGSWIGECLIYGEERVCILRWVSWVVGCSMEVGFGSCRGKIILLWCN